MATEFTIISSHSSILPGKKFNFPSIPKSSVLQRNSEFSLSLSRNSNRKTKAFIIKATLEEFSPDDFAIERVLGTYGFMSLSSIPPGSASSSGVISGSPYVENEGAGFDLRELNRMSGVEVDRGKVEIKLYKARMIQRGSRLGTRVILKSYPGRFSGGKDAEFMATNELVAHSALQDSQDGELFSNNVSFLLGGFQSSTGEQWLVFRDNGIATAVTYCQLASEATAGGVALGEWELMDRFDRSRPIQRRRQFVIQIIRGAMSGLAFAHSRGRLHQSLGPASIILNTMEEKDRAYLVPKLRDFSFSVDVSDEAILSAPSNTGQFGFSDELWRRASREGARSPFEKKSFGIADDIYAAGLLVAYLTFVPFCLPGSIDGPSLQRLFETTFRLDLNAARDYCAEDERWTEAVSFLDSNNGAGWDLLKCMLNPEYRLRPSAAAVLKHPFLSGS